MAEMTLDVGVGVQDVQQLTLYTGEQFPLHLTFAEKDGGDAVAIDDDTELSMTLGSIVKGDAQFDKSYGDSNQAKVELNEEDTESEGVYTGQVTVRIYDQSTGDLRIIKSSPIKLVILSGNASLTIEELRLFLRDTADLNTLHNQQLWTDEDLMLARSAALDEWNSQAGQHPQYNVNDFPAKWVAQWRKGAMSQALFILSDNWRLNRLPYSAGGTTVDLRGQAEAIAKRATELQVEWLGWIRRQQNYDTVRRGYYRLTRSR